MSLWQEIKKGFTSGTTLNRLIYINAAVFLVIKVVEMVSVLLSNDALAAGALRILALPADPGSFISRPWTIITYMFLHQGFFHIIFNMLWLYWFGKIFLDYLDPKKLVSVYILGGLTGGLLYMLSYNIFPAFAGVTAESIAIGASASVMAIVIATAAYVPEYTVYLFLFGKVKIKYLAIIIFVLTSVVDFSVNTGGKIAHIGGALWGFLYILNLRKGRDLGRGLNKVLDAIFTLFKPAKKLKVTYRKPTDDYEYNKVKKEKQVEVNRILEKISKGGYDSLTRDEKDFLFNESQK